MSKDELLFLTIRCHEVANGDRDIAVRILALLAEESGRVMEALSRHGGEILNDLQESRESVKH